MYYKTMLNYSLVGSVPIHLLTCQRIGKCLSSSKSNTVTRFTKKTIEIIQLVKTYIVPV